WFGTIHVRPSAVATAPPTLHHSAAVMTSSVSAVATAPAPAATAAATAFAYFDTFMTCTPSLCGCYEASRAANSAATFSAIRPASRGCAATASASAATCASDTCGAPSPTT